MSDNNLFIDANIIYSLCNSLDNDIVKKAINSRDIGLTKFNSKAQKERGVKSDLNFISDVAEVLNEIHKYVKSFDNICLPKLIRGQTLHQLANIADLNKMFEQRLSEYLFLSYQGNKGYFQNNLDENLKLCLPYKQIHSLVMGLFSETEDGCYYSDSSKAFEDYLKQVNEIFPIKKVGHANDRGADEIFSALVLDSAYQGHQSVAFSSDLGIHKAMHLSLAALKPASQIANNASLEALLNNMPSFARFNRESLIFEQGIEFDESLSVKDTLELYNIEYTNKEIGNLGVTTIYLLRTLGCY